MNHLRTLVPLQLYKSSLKILKTLKTNGQVKLINFQDPTFDGDFDKFCNRTMSHLLEKLVGNQYLEIHRILVPLPVSAKYERHCLCSTD